MYLPQLLEHVLIHRIILCTSSASHNLNLCEIIHNTAPDFETKIHQHYNHGLKFLVPPGPQSFGLGFWNICSIRCFFFFSQPWYLVQTASPAASHTHHPTCLGWHMSYSSPSPWMSLATTLSVSILRTLHMGPPYPWTLNLA